MTPMTTGRTMSGRNPPGGPTRRPGMGATARPLLGSGLLLAGLGTATGCAPSDRDCVPPASDCSTTVDFQGSRYVESGSIQRRLKVERVGTAHLPPCYDTSYPGSCPPTEAPTPVQVFRVPGYDPAEVIALRRSNDRTVTTLISDDLSDERIEDLRLELAPPGRGKDSR